MDFKVDVKEFCFDLIMSYLVFTSNLHNLDDIKAFTKKNHSKVIKFIDSPLLLYILEDNNYGSKNSN